MQRAGSHGSYATQFWTRPSQPLYRSRRETLTAYSKKALQRRLVLPLDAHNWGRALEVLSARYARLGRTVKDYQRVVRGLATETTPRGQSDAVNTLNMLRDKAYAGEMESGSLWVTLVWAYARLGRPQEGYECLLQARRRAHFSPLTWHHMAELLLPLLAESGLQDEIKYLVTNFLKPGGSISERNRVAGFVAEAAARSGSWERAIASLQQQQESKRVDGVTGGIPVVPFARTLTNLFVTDEAVGSAEVVVDKPKHMQGLSTEALRSMMCAMANDGHWVMALHCAQELEGHCQKKCDFSPTAVEKTKRFCSSPSLSESELQCLLNCLGSRYQWEKAVALFLSSQRCSDAGASHGKMQPLHTVTLNLLFASFPCDRREFPLLDPRGKCGPGAFDTTQQEGRHKAGSFLEFDTPRHPQQVVALLDYLLSERDDIFITDWMMMAVGPALLQLGNWDRALHLLRQTPALVPGNLSVFKSETERNVRKQLVALLYYLHGSISLEAECYTLCHFPHAFPKELFRHLPPPLELKSCLQEWKQEQQEEKDMREETRIPPSPLVSSIRKPFTSQRRSEIVHHTERMDGVLKQRLAALYADRVSSFHTHGDADRDPRPPPKGLHDTASGWNFYGRGGEMVFMNHKRTAHPFSLHPKIMRSLADPYRGWNVKQNSCWGHRERLRKWNGHSAV